MPEPNVDVLRALLPDPGTDVTQLFRDEDSFASTAEAVAELFDPAVESVPAWRCAGTTYSGIDGFREMWLDWLEQWASYHVQVDEMFDVGDSVVVLVRDRARRHGMDVEVELISGLNASNRADRALAPPLDDEQASRVPPPSLLHIAKSSRLAQGAAGCCKVTPVADAIGRFLHGAHKPELLLRCLGASGSDGRARLRMHRRVLACARSAIQGRRSVRARADARPAVQMSGHESRRR